MFILSEKLLLEKFVKKGTLLFETTKAGTYTFQLPVSGVYKFDIYGAGGSTGGNASTTSGHTSRGSGGSGAGGFFTCKLIKQVLSISVGAGGGINIWTPNRPPGGDTVITASEGVLTCGGGTGGSGWGKYSCAAGVGGKYTNTIPFIENSLKNGNDGSTAMGGYVCLNGAASVAPYALENMYTMRGGSGVICTYSRTYDQQYPSDGYVAIYKA